MAAAMVTVLGAGTATAQPAASGDSRVDPCASAGRSYGFGGHHGVGREAAHFGRDLGADLVRRSVAVIEDVVLVVEFGEPLSQGQLMSVGLMNPERNSRGVSSPASMWRASAQAAASWPAWLATG